MSPSPSQSNSNAAFSELKDLLSRQKKNFSDYLRLLRLENDAIEQNDTDKLERYQVHETTCREQIVATTTALNRLEGTAFNGPAEREFLQKQKNQLEELRREAVAANTLTQERLAVKMKDVASELTALGERLRTLEGGKSRDRDDPKFIDVYQ